MKKEKVLILELIPFTTIKTKPMKRLAKLFLWIIKLRYTVQIN